MPDTDLPIRAATETAIAHGIIPDRCDILQNGSTLVLRLTETLVARVVQDTSGPRQGTEWFARENAIAQHLTANGAPVIPLHPDLPPGPHEHLGYPINFWQFVTRIEAEPEPREIGRTLRQCHEIMSRFAEPLPHLAIITESLQILRDRELFPHTTQQMLRHRLEHSMEVLNQYPHQPVHGDAHLGNLMNTTLGLLWTDWEDTFSGPVEWDVASAIWNAQILDEDHATVQAVCDAYCAAGGRLDAEALKHSLIARAAVMTAWYPILYPQPNAERQMRLQRRIEWLRDQAGD
ncbi:phosphotransferase enzyme family protein [Prosthecobacter sp.]|uniref:phosphotransferase enzyme family protein n=1 Tax=Prosthecobacter sp. TaxID=1965333 RepID=UPI00378530FD